MRKKSEIMDRVRMKMLRLNGRTLPHTRRHGNTGQNFLTRPEKYLTRTRFFDPKQKRVDP